MDAEKKAECDNTIAMFQECWRLVEEKLIPLCQGLPDGEARYLDICRCLHMLVDAELAMYTAQIEDEEKLEYIQAYVHSHVTVDPDRFRN